MKIACKTVRFLKTSTKCITIGWLVLLSTQVSYLSRSAWCLDWEQSLFCSKIRRKNGNEEASAKPAGSRADARATRDFAPVLLCSSREFLSKRETGRMQSCAMSYWFPLQVFPLHIHDPHALRWAIRTPCASWRVHDWAQLTVQGDSLIKGRIC